MLPAIGSVMISDTQQRHVERFEQWRLQLRSFLTGKRGRASRLAEHLGVRRQNVSRWFVSRSGYKRDVPAWAAYHPGQRPLRYGNGGGAMRTLGSLILLAVPIRGIVLVGGNAAVARGRTAPVRTLPRMCADRQP